MNRKLSQIQRNLVHHPYDHSSIIVCIGNLWVGARPEINDYTLMAVPTVGVPQNVTGFDLLNRVAQIVMA